MSFLLAASCSKQRDDALMKLRSGRAKDRIEAVRELSKLAPDEVVRALKDPSREVRIEAAAALGPRKPELAAELLRDPDDGVRIAAAKAIGCRPYLHVAWQRSDAVVRQQLAAICPIAELQRADESDRRRRAHEALKSPSAAQRARAVRELGLLGRDEDVQQLLPLLQDRDGVIVAAAARALGDAGAAQAVPQLAKLVDEKGEVGQAAADALAQLGGGRDALARLSESEDEDDALHAAQALANDPDRCALAAKARAVSAVRLLAPGCDAHLFAKRPLDAAALTALLESQGPAPEVAKPLAAQLARRDPLVPQVAAHLGVDGPQLLAQLRKESSREPVERKVEPEEPRGEQIPDKARYAELMAKLAARQGAVDPRARAQNAIDALLKGGSDDAFVIALLKAVRALQPKGWQPEVARFQQDPNHAIAAAARGEEPVHKPPESGPPPSPFSPDGAERAQACAGAPAALKAALQADPERRVRVACASQNETTTRK